MPFSASAFNPESYLDEIGQLDDGAIDLGLAAIALAADDHNGVSLGRFIAHLDGLAQKIKKHHIQLLAESKDDSAALRLEACVNVIVKDQGYNGNNYDYDDVSNADLISVIETQRGMPIALSVLYIHCGHVLGWDIVGLNMPGHFLCRMEYEGQRLIFDPFDDGRVLHAGDLRQILKRTQGDMAELSAEYFDAATRRDILIRLQNNIKLRLIEQEEYSRAVRVVEKMRRIDPREYRLLLDAGVLYARLEQPLAAARALEGYIDKAPNPQDRQEAAILLQQIREKLQ